MVHVTEHAFEKGKERLSLNKKSLEKLANLAFDKGLKHSDMKAYLKKYIDKMYFRNKSANNIRVYGEVLFIFVEDRLVTLYQLPQNLKKYIKL